MTTIVWKIYNFCIRYLSKRKLITWEQHALPASRNPGEPPKVPLRFILENEGEVHLMTNDGAQASAEWNRVRNLPGSSKFWDQQAAVPLRAEHNT